MTRPSHNQVPFTTGYHDTVSTHRPATYRLLPGERVLPPGRHLPVFGAAPVLQQWLRAGEVELTHLTPVRAAKWAGRRWCEPAITACDGDRCGPAADGAGEVARAAGCRGTGDNTGSQVTPAAGGLETTMGQRSQPWAWRQDGTESHIPAAAVLAIARE